MAAWNVQALFDAIDDGREYDEYRPESGWTEGAYEARLRCLGDRILALVDGGPDLVVLTEVEGPEVARDLAEGPLAKAGYRWTAASLPPGCPLAPALLSRYPIVDSRSRLVSAEGSAFSRPMLELRVDVRGTPLAILACHWKSKLGGAQETEASRIAAAALAARRIAALEEEEPSLDLVLAGDLNECVDEFLRRGSRARTAILTDDADLAALAAAAGSGLSGKFLVATAGRPPRRADGDAVWLYSPWFDAPWEGSYYHDGWETIDNLLLAPALFDGKGLEYAAFRVADDQELTDRLGRPRRYDPSTGRGVSDHLPILATFVIRGGEVPRLAGGR